MIKKLKIIFSLILVFVLVVNIQGVTFGQDKKFCFCLKLLDRYGKSVPNAKIKIVAVSERGEPYGPTYEWSWNRLSGIDGVALGGLVVNFCVRWKKNG